MRKIIMAIAMAMALLSAGAMAQGTKGLMFGGKAGFMKPHGSDNDAGFNVGAVLGKPIQGNLSWEAELMLGMIDGEVGNNNDWSINSVAGYAVYRSQGDVHVKAKLGISLWDDDNNDDDTNLTAGIGLGFIMGRGILDVEYTQVNPTTDYITVGYILPF
ncbi:MAG: outer membrane beta-barrel protein [Burkholderiales bacterium]